MQNIVRASGVILFDDRHQLLVVTPTYRAGWLLPGGIVEDAETPLDAAQREVAEELGVVVPTMRLLCIDWQRESMSGRDNVQLLFYGGVLSSEQRSVIRLPPSELLAHRLVSVDDALALLTPHSARRLPHAMHALNSHAVLVLEDGVPTSRGDR
ncbi:MAG: NUDIX hydrolase [Vicinamibacterales bacterium]